MPPRKAEPTAEPIARFPSRDAFEDWLHSLPAQSVVSRGWGHCDCPMAKWIGATRHTPIWIEPAGGGAGLWFVPGTREAASGRKLPGWASRFADIIDTLNEGPDSEVTAADCIRALKDA